MQMLVAAFNPSITIGTNINALLFSDNVRGTGPSPVFSAGTPCFDAVQGQDSSLSLLSLMLDYRNCVDSGGNYDSMLFPSLCGESTLAVPGLREIYHNASTARILSNATVLMLTNGTIRDDVTDLANALNDLRSLGINTLIAAGIDDADIENLNLDTSADILVGSDPVQLSIAIVNQMTNRSILCQEHGNITLGALAQVVVH